MAIIAVPSFLRSMRSESDFIKIKLQNRLKYDKIKEKIYIKPSDVLKKR